MSQSYMDMLFSSSCLYAAVLVLFGMLSLHKSPFHRRREIIQQFYGHHPQAMESRPTTWIGQKLEFSKHFLLRQSVMIGIMAAFFIIRNYSDAVLSVTLAFGLTSALLSQYSDYETKFIPAVAIGVGFLYGVAHVMGYINDWHVSPLRLS